MYRELDASALRDLLGITEAELPDVLVIFGEMNVHGAARRMASYLENVEPLARFPGYASRHGSRRVVLQAAFGGAMAAHYVHTWCGAGVKSVLQLGWFGALQEGMQPGDVVIPRHAAREEGVSDWYLAKGILADATPELADAIGATLAMRGIAVHEGPLFTTPAMLAESRDVILDWSRHGWVGVDMETASTFAVAKHFEAQRAAALVLWDDLITETNSFADLESRPRVVPLMREREEQVLKAALDAVAG